MNILDDMGRVNYQEFYIVKVNSSFNKKLHLWWDLWPNNSDCAAVFPPNWCHFLEDDVIKEVPFVFWTKKKNTERTSDAENIKTYKCYLYNLYIYI